MSNDKLVIDLKRLNLTNKQRQAIHNAIHKTVIKQLEKIFESSEEELLEEDSLKEDVAAPAIATRSVTATAVHAATANLHVTFFNANTGLTELTAILNSQRQSVAQSGVISFQNVQSSDLILLQKNGNGRCVVTIDIGAVPMQVSFPPGRFVDQFFIS